MHNVMACLGTEKATLKLNAGLPRGDVNDVEPSTVPVPASSDSVRRVFDAPLGLPTSSDAVFPFFFSFLFFPRCSLPRSAGGEEGRARHATSTVSRHLPADVSSIEGMQSGSSGPME